MRKKLNKAKFHGRKKGLIRLLFKREKPKVSVQIELDLFNDDGGYIYEKTY